MIDKKDDGLLQMRLSSSDRDELKKLMRITGAKKMSHALRISMYIVNGSFAISKLTEFAKKGKLDYE